MITFEVNTPNEYKKFYLSEEDKDKYLILTCAKNEDKYIVEFVEHYLNLGFDKVIIADNNDEPTLETILRTYIESGKVQILNFRGSDAFQVHLYAAFAGLGNYKWCGYFDADEFLELRAFLSVKDFLRKIKENCVLFHWINFGSNGHTHYENKPLSERFPKPVSPIIYFKENCFVKSIVRGGDYWRGCWFNGSHIPYFIDKELYYKNVYNIGGYSVTEGVEYSYMHCRYPLLYKNGFIRHYYTKSFDEWILKSSRGWPDGTPSLAASTFFAFNEEGKFDFNKIIYAAFGDNSDFYNDITKHSEFYKEILDKYSVIQISNDSTLIYSLIIIAVACMKAVTNHTFIFKDKHIDDTLFTFLLECGFHTGNNVVYCFNDEDVWNTYLKYHNKKEGTYYIIECN